MISSHNICCLLTKTLALLSDLVDEDFGRNDGAKRHKQVIEVSVPKVLWQMVDEEVASLWSLLLGRWLRLGLLLNTKHTAVGVGCAVALQPSS